MMIEFIFRITYFPSSFESFVGLLGLYQFKVPKKWLAICIFIECERSINSPSAPLIFYDDVNKTSVTPQNHTGILGVRERTTIEQGGSCACWLQLNIQCYILWTPPCGRFTAYPRRFYGVSKWHIVFIGRVYICVWRCFTAPGTSVSPWPLLAYIEEDVLS